jgi:hypothetical protein
MIIFLGFTGSRAEAENIKQRLTQFLRDELKLELSQEKTLITHARSQAARFLGYDISAYHGHTKLSHGRRLTGGFIQLKVPRAVIKAKTTQYFRRGKPAHRSGLVNQDDYTIIATYGAEYRGLVQYYLLAGNVYWFNRVEWAMSSSMLKTLASKHRSSVVKMAARHRAHIGTPHGKRTCYEAQIHRPGRAPLVARFGGIPLTRRKTAVLHDRQPSRVGISTQGDHLPAPPWHMRAMRVPGRYRGPPSPGSRRPRTRRTRFCMGCRHDPQAT